MAEALIIDAVRTPVGRRRGRLAGWHAADLGAEPLRALVDRNAIDASALEDVIMGCVTQVGEQGMNVARSAALAAGYPEGVPATTIDRQCGSSQQAAHFAAQGVIAGAYDLVVAAGVESMTRVPMFSNVPNPSEAYGTGFRGRYGLDDDAFVHQGHSGEMVARRFGLGRAELDAFAAESHRRAARATDEGRFADEIVAVDTGPDGPMRADEGIRPDTSEEVLAGLAPAFAEDGVLTAGNSSQISDAAAAVLIASPEAAERHGLRPMARFRSFALAGVDPIEMLTGPIPATRRVLDRAGMRMGDVDLFEVNEAFASIPLAWARELDADLDRVNVSGGAIALGHPLGCTGARLMTTLVHEMRRRGAAVGLQVMCEGGGMANATILELTP